MNFETLWTYQIEFFNDKHPKSVEISANNREFQYRESSLRKTQLEHPYTASHINRHDAFISKPFIPHKAIFEMKKTCDSRRIKARCNIGDNNSKHLPNQQLISKCQNAIVQVCKCYELWFYFRHFASCVFCHHHTLLALLWLHCLNSRNWRCYAIAAKMTTETDEKTNFQQTLQNPMQTVFLVSQALEETSKMKILTLTSHT